MYQRPLKGTTGFRRPGRAARISRYGEQTCVLRLPPLSLAVKNCCARYPRMNSLAKNCVQHVVEELSDRNCETLVMQEIPCSDGR